MVKLQSLMCTRHFFSPRSSLLARGHPGRCFSTSHRLQDKIPFRVSGSGTGVAQSVSVEGSPHKISVDAYASFGGADSAPSPLAYNLSSLSSCTQVTGSLVGKDLGFELGKWDVSVKGILDPKVLTKGDEGNSNWDRIELTVSVQTNQRDEAAFQKFASETERRCPITQLFKRSGVDWKSKWVNQAL